MNAKKVRLFISKIPGVYTLLAKGWRKFNLSMGGGNCKSKN